MTEGCTKFTQEVIVCIEFLTDWFPQTTLCFLSHGHFNWGISQHGSCFSQSEAVIEWESSSKIEVTILCNLILSMTIYYCGHILFTRSKGLHPAHLQMGLDYTNTSMLECGDHCGEGLSWKASSYKGFDVKLSFLLWKCFRKFCMYQNLYSLLCDKP